MATKTTRTWPRKETDRDSQRELTRAVETVHALLADLDAYLEAAHRVLPEVGRVETDEGRRLFGFVYRYLDDAHALGKRAVVDAKRLAELAIASERGPSARLPPATLGKLTAIKRRTPRAMQRPTSRS